MHDKIKLRFKRIVVYVTDNPACAPTLYIPKSDIQMLIHTFMYMTPPPVCYGSTGVSWRLKPPGPTFTNMDLLESHYG